MRRMAWTSSSPRRLSAARPSSARASGESGIVLAPRAKTPPPWLRASGRSRPSSSAAARRGARARRTTAAGSGSGSRKMWRWSKAARRRAARERSRPLPKTSPLMSPMPMTVSASRSTSRPQLAEVLRDALPGAARGDAHLLVVVAVRAAGGEGVAEPEAVLGGDLVGDVGERRRALVGGDDQVGIGVVVAARCLPGGTTRSPTRLSVRSSSAAMKRPVRASTGARRRSRRALDDEAALGADRDDDRVLHRLRLHQAEDLGAEVVGAIAPADAAARDAAGAQVDALHARAVHEDLVERPRRRQVRDAGAVDLDRDRVAAAVARPAIEVGAHGRGDHGAEARAACGPRRCSATSSRLCEERRRAPRSARRAVGRRIEARREVARRAARPASDGGSARRPAARRLGAAPIWKA